MAVYQGSRPVLPGQNSNDWVHNVSGKKGVYSNWSRQSSTHVLAEAPDRDHTPGSGDYPHGVLLSQMFNGDQRYAPMENSKYSHGGQDAPYLHHERHQFHGVAGAAAFPSGFGHDGTREFTYSRFVNDGALGVDSQLRLDGGHEARDYGTAIANVGPVKPHNYQGVGPRAVDSPGNGETLASRRSAPRYGYQQVRTFQGVPSAKAL